MRIAGIIILCLLSIPAYARGSHGGSHGHAGHSSFQYGLHSSTRNSYHGESPFSRARKYQRYQKREHGIESQWLKNFNKGKRK